MTDLKTRVVRYFGKEKKEREKECCCCRACLYVKKISKRRVARLRRVNEVGVFFPKRDASLC